jgi:hypothetical protein
VSLGNLGNLKELVLFGNKLSSLPDIFSGMQRLKDLSLEYNKLSSLPQSFCQLRNLWYVQLTENNLTSLPDCIGQLPELRMLQMSFNKLTTLPDSFARMTKLHYITLNKNPLQTLPVNIQNMSQMDKIGTDRAKEHIYEKKSGESVKRFFERCYNFQWRAVNPSLVNATAQGQQVASASVVLPQQPQNTTVSSTVREESSAKSSSSHFSLKNIFKKALKESVKEALLGPEPEPEPVRVNPEPQVVVLETQPKQQVYTAPQPQVIVQAQSVSTGAHLSLMRPYYLPDEAISVRYSNMPTTGNNWISITYKGSSDSEYIDYFYPYGKASGTYAFTGRGAGSYEIRVYYDFATTGYKVQERIPFEVKSY